jgi:sorbitol-specific phosphotransferase system component IIC
MLSCFASTNMRAIVRKILPQLIYLFRDIVRLENADRVERIATMRADQRFARYVPSPVGWVTFT